MRAFVFTDKALARHAGQFVWLSVDTEKTGNAGFLQKFPVQVWPSFLVIEPASERIVLRWVGGATVPQLEKILADGRLAASPQHRGVEEILARADRLYGEGKNAEAAAAYRLALDRAPRHWPRYGRVTESLLFALQSSKSSEACAEIALQSFEKLSRTSSAANVAALGLDCAVALPKDSTARSKLLANFVQRARAILAEPRPDIAADDISSLYESLAGEREDAKDEEGSKKILTARAAFLESEAARAKTPDGRAVFDSHRLGTYLSLGQPERAIPMLEASERDLPGDYNPPARLAVAYKAMKRYDEALAASDRALEKAYGPRKIGILQTRADIYSARGEAAAAKRTMEETLRYAEELPAGQRSEKTIASLKKKLDAMP